MKFILMFGRNWIDCDDLYRSHLIGLAKLFADEYKVAPGFIYPISTGIVFDIDKNEIAGFDDADELGVREGDSITFEGIDLYFDYMRKRLDECTTKPFRKPVIEYTSTCYHCGAPSVKLFSTNECSKKCQG